MVERAGKSGAVKEGPRACPPRGHVGQRAGVSWSVAPSQMEHLRFGVPQVLASRRRAYRGSWFNFCDDHIVQYRQRRQCRQCRQCTSHALSLSLCLSLAGPGAGRCRAPNSARHLLLARRVHWCCEPTVCSLSRPCRCSANHGGHGCVRAPPEWCRVLRPGSSSQCSTSACISGRWACKWWCIAARGEGGRGCARSQDAAGPGGRVHEARRPAPRRSSRECALHQQSLGRPFVAC